MPMLNWSEYGVLRSLLSMLISRLPSCAATSAYKALRSLR